MSRNAFEAELQRQGFAASDGEIKPNEHRSAHAHDFDLRVLVLEGSFDLVIDGGKRALGRGDMCYVPAGTVHEEHAGTDGARYVIGRRSPA
jgi:quercetin dioxygenase-like cupin family protein